MQRKIYCTSCTNVRMVTMGIENNYMLHTCSTMKAKQKWLQFKATELILFCSWWTKDPKHQTLPANARMEMYLQSTLFWNSQKRPGPLRFTTSYLSFSGVTLLPQTFLRSATSVAVSSGPSIYRDPLLITSMQLELCTMFYDCDLYELSSAEHIFLPKQYLA